MKPEQIPGHQRTGPAGTPLTHHPSWPGWVEIIYSCGGIYAMRLTDELPAVCPDMGHIPPPEDSPHQIA